MRFAAQLQSWGLAPGDHVALFTNNKLPFLTAQVAVDCLRAACPCRSIRGPYPRGDAVLSQRDSEAFAVIAGEEQQFLAETLTGELVRPSARSCPIPAVSQKRRQAALSRAEPRRGRSLLDALQLKDDRMAKGSHPHAIEQARLRSSKRLRNVLAGDVRGRRRQRPPLVSYPRICICHTSHLAGWRLCLD